MWLLHYLSYLVPLIVLTTSREVHFYNGITHLDYTIFKDYEVQNVITADFRNCEIQDISNCTFVDATQLKHLYLHFNKIRILNEDVFDSLESLTHLRLDSNELTSIHEKIFHKLHNLLVINLSNNYISYLPPGIFDKNTKLTEISISGNELNVIPFGLYNSLSTLEYLDISNNYIYYIEESALPATIKTFLIYGNRLSRMKDINFQAITKMILDKNPWLCDCHLKTLHTQWKLLHSKFGGTPACHYPEKLRDAKWNTLNSEDFVCDHRDNESYLENEIISIPNSFDIVLNYFVKGNVKLSDVSFMYENNTEISSHLQKTNRKFLFEMKSIQLDENFPIGVNYTFTIFNAKPMDSGVYKCVNEKESIYYKKYSIEVRNVFHISYTIPE